MDSSFCLVLTGRLAAGHDAAAVQARLAQAFDMDEAAFAGQVFARAPLVIRDGLDRDAALDQAAQLLAAGAETDVLPGGGEQAWLLHGQRVCGPLPAAALARYAQPGDAWCRDGERRWQDWAPAAHAQPPPLPVTVAAGTPPALPAITVATPPPPSPRSVARLTPRTVAVLVAVIVLLGLAWRWSDRPRPAATMPSLPGAGTAMHPAEPVSFLPGRDRADTRRCQAPAGAAPGSDEDRFLAAGGHRRLTGRHLRQGDTYVAEAALGYDDDCRFDPLQLYVFRDGVFIGTALSAPAWREDGRRILDFELAGDQALRYRVSDCGNDGGDCDRAVAHAVQLVHRDFGWSLQRDEAEAPPSPPKILSRTAPRYPPAALARRHQGQVLLQIVIGRDGLPGEVRIARSSGYQELDQAAVVAARQWRFQPASRNGRPVVARVRVPVNFVLRP